MIDRLCAGLRAAHPSDILLRDEPMARHTTFRVGGPADIMYFPSSPEALMDAMRLAEAEDVPALVMGNGSNLLARDGGVRALVIALGEALGGISVEGDYVCAQAGARLSSVAAAARDAGLAGLEFASGIPGSVGGAAAMNAGAYGGQLSDAIESVEVIADGRLLRWTRDELEPGYRVTRALKTGAVVVSARFALTKDAPEAISARMNELNRRRREKQPLTLPSAGSFFKRPEGHFAGALIEQCGLKGARVGGAAVSALHAGFIVNEGGATAADVLALADFVRGEVKNRFGVELEMEVRVVGED